MTIPTKVNYSLPTDRDRFLAEWAHVRIVVDRRFGSVVHATPGVLGAWQLDRVDRMYATFRLFCGPTCWYSALGLVVERGAARQPVVGAGGLVFSWEELPDRLDNISGLC